LPLPELDAEDTGRYAPGDVVAGKYRLIRTLGAGGMGVVWVAQNEVLDVHVALKIIDVNQSSRPKQLVARVLTEARTAARLAHPAICRVFDFGESSLGDPFVVSELLHGETLADQLEAEPRIPALRAVQLILPIAEGVALAHRAGIVHRDVKPENIFLSRDASQRLQPKLLDFGIARFVETDQKLTLDGTLLGTPDYMSPEQARGESNVDHRTDIWSLCIVLFELLTGTTPFAADNYNALLWAIIHEDARSTIDYGAGDAALWAILERGLTKDRTQRWNSMRELGEALAMWLLAGGVTEDVCGSSLRATWLEHDAGSDDPERARRSREILSLLDLPPAPGANLDTMPAPAGADADVTETASRPVKAPAHRALRSPRVVAVAGVAALLGALVGVIWFNSVGPSVQGTANSDPPPPASAPTLAASRRPPAAVASVAAAQPAPSVAPPASAVPVDSAAPNASAAPRRPVVYRPRAKPLDPKSYDFGF
jgi:serine/threonine-protein kinase